MGFHTCTDLLIDGIPDLHRLIYEQKNIFRCAIMNVRCVHFDVVGPRVIVLRLYWLKKTETKEK